jgi:hypothetical protein
MSVSTVDDWGAKYSFRAGRTRSLDYNSDGTQPMEQQTAAPPDTFGSRTSARIAKRYPQILLCATILFSLNGGMHFSDGFRHFKVARSAHDWPFDFLHGACWLLLAMMSGGRLLPVSKTAAFITDAEASAFWIAFVASFGVLALLLVLLVVFFR